MKIINYMFLIGAGFMACSCSFKSSVSYQYIGTETVQKDSTIEAMIAPYRSELKEQMSEVLTFAPVNFLNEKPSGNLGNLVADLMLTKLKIDYPNGACIAMVNFGGLRSTINQGNVVLEDVYKLMPFDNELMYVRVKREVLNELLDYMKQSKGEPIAGFKILNGKLQLENEVDEYWIATSDFLVNGGDKMYFLKNNLEVIQTGIPIRTLLIDSFRAIDTLPNSNEIRISW